MKVFIDKNLLVKSLNRVQSIVERRHVVPALANVKIEASGDVLILSTTDMDLFVTDSISARVERSGGVTTPVHTLFEIIKKIPDGVPISISYLEEKNDWRVLIDAGSVKCMLPGLSPEEFPNFISEDYVSKFVIAASRLHQLLANTRYAISIEDPRYYLNGVYLHVVTVDDAHLLRAVATDSHRLVVSDIASPDGSSSLPNIIIPRKAVNEIIKLLDGHEDDVQISVSTNRFVIQAGNTTLMSKLIDGKFPDYAKAIPAQNDKKLEVGVKQLSNAIDLVTTISSDKTKAVKMKIDNAKLTLITSSPANGGSEANQEIEAAFDHEPMGIAFNGRYILDILAIANSQVVSFCLSSESGAAIIQDQNDPSTRHILMPMQV